MDETNRVMNIDQTKPEESEKDYLRSVIAIIK